MAENQETKSKRDAYIERLKAKYPDRPFDDDEALFGQAGADYDEYENQLNGYKEREGQLEEIFRKDPRNAQFFTDMARGDDPWIAVIKRMGTDGVLELINDPAKQEAYAEANKEYAERLAEEKRMEEERDKNLVESEKLREMYDKKFGEAMIDNAIAVIDQISRDALVGKITPATLDMALKMVNHDADMANARSEGEIAGRNAKIEEKLQKQNGGDGMPAMGGSSAAPAVRKVNKSIFDVARDAE